MVKPALPKKTSIYLNAFYQADNNSIEIGNEIFLTFEAATIGAKNCVNKVHLETFEVEFGPNGPGCVTHCEHAKPFPWEKAEKERKGRWVPQ